MVECNRCDEEIDKCENCQVDIVVEADRTDTRCSPDGHFCSLDCALDYYEIERNKIKD